MSLSFKEAEDKVKVYDSKLLATDPRFRGTVHIHHEDGSSFTFDSAFLMRINNWIIVFTEHHRYHIYDKLDLTFFAQYKRVYEIESL